MLTVNALQELGANTEEGMARCLNNESFYLRMVDMGLKDAGFGKLADALQAGDLDAGFEAAHALKGIMANLSLTPIYAPVSEITEMLRRREEADYQPLLAKILEEKEKFTALLA